MRSHVISLAATFCWFATPLAAQDAPKPLDVANMDTTCRACDDFFQFANGGWLRRTTIPASYASYGSFNQLSDRNNDVLHEILESAAADSTARSGTPTQKLGTFYRTCMDSAAADRAGVRAVAQELRAIDGIRTVDQLVRAVGRLHAMGLANAFSFTGRPDAKRSSDVIGYAAQGGLSLPDREYYTKTDERSVKLRDDFFAHAVRTFQLAGTSEARAKRDAQAVVDIETALAHASMSRVQMRDPNAVYHRMTFDSLQRLTPRLRWSSYLAARGFTARPPINVAQPEFFTALNGMLSSVSLAAWRSYVRWKLLDEASPWLGAKFDAENFRFASRLSGVQAQQPRWKRCLAATNGALGELLGQAYVERTFTPEAKGRALQMVENLQAALRERLATLEWMNDSTRLQAVAKLTSFTKKVGYPDQWRDYSALQVRQQPFIRNAIAAGTWSAARGLHRIGRPLDRGEWGMTPPTVNAYYSPNLNEIVFPAGILQPPFFDPDADDAVNYGGMGAVIGHEMTHGFDDQGRQFDAQGNLRDWWTAGDAAKYRTQAERVVEQFNAYSVEDSVRVNGRLTLGENIADLGGLTIAHAALRKSLANKRMMRIDGFTPEQRFFLAWAQIWRRHNRPETARRLILTDPHSPPRWRTNGPLSNMPEFAAAWGCRPGDAMVRPDTVRARIW